MNKFLLSLAISSTIACNAFAAPIKLLPIGDSITQGRSAKGPESPATFSYRYPLWQLFVDAGIDVDFVGSMKGGFEGDPAWDDYKSKPFDRDHEGHWGWSPASVGDQFPKWVKGYAAPDIALILLGTNDADKPEAIPTSVSAHRGMIQALRSRNPQVSILIGLPFQEWKPFPEMRQAYQKLAAELNSPVSRVIAVDHSKDWLSAPTSPEADTVDWIHPSSKGDKKIALNWFAALKPLLAQKGSAPSGK